VPPVATVGESTTILASLQDENLKAILNATIEYYVQVGAIEQKIGLATTDQNGIASTSYTATVAGIFQVKAIFRESTKYLGSSTVSILTVGALATTLTLSLPSITKVEDQVTLTATLKDKNGNPITGSSIDFFIYSSAGWNKIGSATTNASGVASREYTPTEAGTFRFSAEFEGDIQHTQSSSNEASLTVNKLKTTLTISIRTHTTTTQTPVTISATLKDEDGRTLSDSIVYFYILKNEEWIEIGFKPTNVLGNASLFNYQPTEVGTFKVKATYTGSQKHAGNSSEEATLEVTSGNPGNPFDFLGDDQLTVLDLLFWGVIMLAVATFVVAIIRRQIKSLEKQTLTKI